MSFLDSFKSSMLEVVEEAKKGNTDFADELSDRLLEWLDQEFETRLNFKSVHSAIEDINSHLQVISNQHRAKANAFYQNISESSLKDALINFHSRYLRALSAEDFPLACKCLFQQIESCVNFLFKISTLVEIITGDAAKQTRYEFEQKVERYSISFLKKIEAISDHYELELRRIQHFPLNRGYTFDHYNLCYRLRNYESHGIHFDKQEAIFEELEDFQVNYKSYLAAPNRQILKLRDLILKVQKATL